MKTYNHVLARLAGRPLAIAPGRLDALLAAAGAPGLDVRGAGPPSSRGHALTGSGIAVVPVVGPLVSRSDWLTSLFGAVSYGEVRDAVEGAFADPASRAVLLEVDSPGGEIGGLFDLVERIASLREETGKPLWAVASENALSAAFAIASVSTRIYVTRTGEVGSVGVVAVHVDESAADAMAGLKWTLIHAGARKIDGNPHEPLSGPAFGAIQADVDTLHGQLVALVARNRGLAPEAVRATEAAIYRGALGIDIGFADRLGPLERALADLAGELDAPRAASARKDRTPTPRTERTMPMTADTPAGEQPAVAAQVSAALPSPPAGRSPPAFAKPASVGEGRSTGEGPTPSPEPPAPAPAESASAPVETPATEVAAVDRLRAEYAEIAAVAAQAARLGVAVDAADAMRKGVRPDALRRTVLDALAARAEAAEVVAAAPAPPGTSSRGPATGDGPIVRRARERAAQAKEARL